jgi:hypothetical protein
LNQRVAGHFENARKVGTVGEYLNFELVVHFVVSHFAPFF